MTRDAGPGPDDVAPPAGVARIVVIGSESTGKTELTEWLAAELTVPWSAEYAREYAEARGGGAVLTAADVDPIARGQLALENAAVTAAGAAALPLVLHDTDLLSTAVYAAAYYGAEAVPPWLRHATLVRRADLYLFCDIDIPWRPDDVRDAAADRETMQRRFVQALAEQPVPVARIGGSFEERRTAALAACRAFTGSSRNEPGKGGGRG